MSRLGKFRLIKGMHRYMGADPRFKRGCLYHVRFTYRPIMDVYRAFIVGDSDRYLCYDSISHFYSEWQPVFTPKMKFHYFSCSKASFYVSEQYLADIAKRPA